MQAKFSLLAACCAAVLTLSACGGGSDDSGAPAIAGLALLTQDPPRMTR